jgi:hypothetical protein
MPIPTSLVLSVVASTREGDASLTALAKRARRSPFDLHRAFARVTGGTPRRRRFRQSPRAYRAHSVYPLKR